MWVLKTPIKGAKEANIAPIAGATRTQSGCYTSVFSNLAAPTLGDLYIFTIRSRELIIGVLAMALGKGGVNLDGFHYLTAAVISILTATKSQLSLTKPYLAMNDNKE